MHNRLSISIVAALALSAAASGVARAQSKQASSGQTTASSHSPTNDEINAQETGSPASVDNPKREISKHQTTKDEINAAEKGSPASTDYGNREVSGKDANAAWRALDKGVPASVEGEVIEEQPATGESEQEAGK
jgi:hypothetical protein